MKNLKDIIYEGLKITSKTKVSGPKKSLIIHPEIDIKDFFDFAEKFGTTKQNDVCWPTDEMLNVFNKIFKVRTTSNEWREFYNEKVVNFRDNLTKKDSGYSYFFNRNKKNSGAMVKNDQLVVHCVKDNSKGKVIGRVRMDPDGMIIRQFPDGIQGYEKQQEIMLKILEYVLVYWYDRID